MHYVSLFLLALISRINGSQYLAEIEQSSLGLFGTISMSVQVSDLDDSIQISVTGPSSVYYSVGVGSCKMDGTWALIVPGATAASTTPYEQLLGSDRAGSTLESTLDVVEDIDDGQQRTVTMTRLLSSEVGDDYYAFSTDDESISVIYAWGATASYGYHQGNFGCAPLTFAKTLQAEDSHFLQVFSSDVFYFVGHSSISLLLVSLFLISIMSYAVYRHCCSNKKFGAFKFAEMESLIAHAPSQTYSEI
mmetsp:Transcript_40109/g.65792  ORF Transcript_40109/g.65792 Transcript_40109/m.65792 type:complete len:248 (+) Transcript_40109:91-834(+)